MTKLKLEKKDNTVEIKISSSNDEWKNFIKKAKKNLVDNLELKGFRKGKVPLEIADKNISPDEIRNDAANLLLDKNYKKAMEMISSEDIATRPTLSIVKISDDEIVASLKSTLMPDVKLGNMDSIKVTYKKTTASEKEIKDEFEKVNKYLVENKKVKEGSLIKKGNIVNIDFLGKVNSKPFKGGDAKGFDLEIGSKSFIDNFEEQLIGMKKGEEKVIKVKFPDEYPSEDLKGKKASFDVKINEIYEKVKLKGKKLQDKLETLGIKSLEEVLERIKNSLNDNKKNNDNETFFRKYMDEILKLKDTIIEIPSEIIDQQVEEEWKRIEVQITQQNMKMGDYLKMLGMTEKEFKEKNLVQSSTKRLKDGMVYSKLIKHFEIKLSDAEIEKEYKKIAELNNVVIEKIKEEISIDSLKDNLIFEKLINKLKK